MVLLAEVTKNPEFSPESSFAVRHRRAFVSSSYSQGFLFGGKIMERLCECGCGKSVTWNKWNKEWNRFLKGHRLSKPKYIPNEIGPMCGCGCGCGLHVKWSVQKNSWNRFVLYHGNSKLKTERSLMGPKLCKCGCGEEVFGDSNYIKGHGNRTDRYWRIQEDLNTPRLCECGCEKEVTPGRRFISGHNKGNFRNIVPKKPTLCQCGCGEYAKPGNDYIHGHYWIGKTHTKETIEKIVKKNSSPSDETRIRLSRAARQRELVKSIKLGLTQSKYCDAWEDTEYRNDLRKGACEKCGITNMMCMKVSSMQLSTHHRNGKDKCAPDDIITFCTSCHMRLESELRKRGYSGRFA